MRGVGLFLLFCIQIFIVLKMVTSLATFQIDMFEIKNKKGAKCEGTRDEWMVPSAREDLPLLQVMLEHTLRWTLLTHSIHEHC